MNSSCFPWAAPDSIWGVNVDWIITQTFLMTQTTKKLKTLDFLLVHYSCQAACDVCVQCGAVDEEAQPFPSSLEFFVVPLRAAGGIFWCGIGIVYKGWKQACLSWNIKHAMLVLTWFLSYYFFWRIVELFWSWVGFLENVKIGCKIQRLSVLWQMLTCWHIAWMDLDESEILISLHQDGILVQAG